MISTAYMIDPPIPTYRRSDSLHYACDGCHKGIVQLPVYADGVGWIEPDEYCPTDNCTGELVFLGANMVGPRWWGDSA